MVQKGDCCYSIGNILALVVFLLFDAWSLLSTPPMVGG